jgi:hypothetical protein
MGTAVAHEFIKWFILRPLFYILIQVLWPFIYGLGVNFLAVYETGWNSGDWLTRGMLIFITLGFLGLLVGIFAPKKEAQENRHRVRCVMVNVVLNLFCLLDRMVKPFLLKTAKIRQKFLRKNFFNRLRGFPSHVVCVIHVDI